MLYDDEWKSVPCREWTHYNDQDGYGMVVIPGQTHTSHRAHRLAWQMYNGPIPKGLFVLHKCDNPPCYEIAHLFLGTNADNMADAVAKGRFASHLGIKNPFAKLTDDDVKAMRARFSEGSITYTALAREYGIDRGTASKIVRRKSWSHVE